MKIDIVDDQGNVEESKPREVKTPVEVPMIPGEMLVFSVAQMFDILPTEIGNYREKINLLVEYAHSQTEDRSPEGVKWAIRSLQGKVGTPPLGEKWINYLGKYAYLKLEGIKLQKDVEKYERNP